MKSLKLVAFILAVSSMTACAQNKNNVPGNVKGSFGKKFPNAKEVKWDKENETEWEAEFEIQGKDYSANFLADGTWKETEYEINEAEIPAPVKKTLDKKFTGYDIEEAEISETADGKVYEFALEKNETDIEVVITPVGKVVKKKGKKEEEEEDED